MINRYNRIWLLVIGYWLLVNLSGCAAMSENIKGLAGYPTKILERNRKQAIVKTLDYDYSSAYSKILGILKRGETYVYAQDIKKHLIALYVSEEDTTPVGVFFTEQGKDKTQIEISSPSVYGKELISKKITLSLEGGQLDDKGRLEHQ